MNTLLKQQDDLAPEIRQRQASHPENSVWVNASAGSGKTTVLTHRVTRLLLDGVPPERILCLTFTRAAAAEMSNRMTGKLSHWATCSEDELRCDLDKLQGTAPTPDQLTAARRLFARVLSCPGGMRIRTIHAFCQEILRRFPVEAGLPPHFAVIEENDAHALLKDVQDALLREAATTPNAPLGRALKSLVCDLGEKGFTEAMRGILNERAQIDKAVEQAGCLENLIALMRDELSLTPDDTVEKIQQAALDDKNLPKAILRQAAQWLSDDSPLFAKRGNQLRAWLDLTPHEQAAKFDTYCRCFLTGDEEPFAKCASKAMLAKHPELHPLLDSEALRLKKIKEQLDAAQLAENTQAVLIFGTALIQGYQTRKKAQAALDYNDLVIHADELLRRPGIAPWVLFKLDGGLDHILVDEAQDTSRAQWNIVAALTDDFFAGTTRTPNNRTLFVVGDEKQSIFSFQNADPQAFTERRGFFELRLNGIDKKLHAVGLRTSFRSAPAVLQAVDQVFAHDRARSGVSMETIEHRVGGTPKAGRVEVWPLQPAPPKDLAEEGAWPLPFGYEKEQDQQAELAALIAAKIKYWLDHKENLCGHNRPINAGDIMILLRRRGRFADLMVRALKEQNVPVTGVDRMSLVKQLPVMDLLALMQFALLPEDDLNTATVLRGPLLGLSEEDLMQLAMGRKGSLWNSLSNKAQFTSAHTYLSRWLSVADFMTPFSMLSKILNEKCPGSNLSGRHAVWARLGADALDPVDELLNAAQNFSRTHTPSLQHFLHWIMATEAEIKREMDRSGGQVRLMTVHASKGLEAPIVFLPDTAGVPRVQDMPKFLWSLNDVPLYAPRKPKSVAAKNLWDAARQKQMEEYRRLLYVALTRAATRLYIAGCEPTRREPNDEESWYNLCADALKPLHAPAALPPSAPVPDVAFADPEHQPPDKNHSIVETQIAATPIALPAWTRQEAPTESQNFKSLTPSHEAQVSATATPDKAFARGRIIHRLLQSLPEIDDTKRDTIAARFLANPRHRLTQEQQTEIQNEVLSLLRNQAYAPLFSSDSRAEVPLVGRINGKTISGQVDRLSLQEDAVWIVDYKTNRPPPANAADAPLAYRQQLASYRAVLQQIYPHKPIRCFLLWTYEPRLMELTDALLTGLI